MPFDPNQPQQGELIDAVQLRNQFNELKTLIDEVPAGPPGPEGPVGPQGEPGPGLTMRGDWQSADHYVPGDVVVYSELSYVALVANTSTQPGTSGAWRLLSIVGPPGEVTTAQLESAILGTGRNPTSVMPLGMIVSDPPTQAEVQQIANKLDELIAAVRREP